MSLHRSALGFLLFLSLGLVSPATADPAPSPGSPAAVVQALYRACIDHSTGFDVESMKLAKPYLAPDLYARILKKLNQPTPKGDAPDIDGDIFLDAQDLPTSFSLGQNVGMGPGEASVEVILKWSNETRHYTVSLVQIDGAWKITDIKYDKDGTLLDLLK